jgi:hypothetical protein
MSSQVGNRFQLFISHHRTKNVLFNPLRGIIMIAEPNAFGLMMANK